MVEWSNGLMFWDCSLCLPGILYSSKHSRLAQRKTWTSNSVYYSLLQDLHVGSVFNEGTVIDVDCLLQPHASALFVEIWPCLSARNATTSTGRD